ncbi:MAG: DUF262 domain-containing protein [Desulfobacteraceae bacterium]|nr:DUF262 domain-containing protein [Desulfobacteraceae bacterium]
MSLQEEIERKAKAVHTDAYPMSIGELISLYQDGEIDLHPEFQRFFRWKPLQKTRFIESILIGIPIPSIFVYQRDDGIWDVIDGVQRLSTIFEFVGILEDEQGSKYDSLELEKGDYLPSLKGKMWKKENDDDDDADDLENYFTMFQRIAFKRAKLDIKIISEDSAQDARYELFKRINTGGTSLSEQEVRNFLLVMINENFYSFLRELASNANFQICTQIPDDDFELQNDMELISKFLIFRHSDPCDVENAVALSDFITDRITGFAKNGNFDMKNEKDVFERTFNLLGVLKGDSFKKFDKIRNEFSGQFSIAAYEAIAIGLGANIDKWKNDDADKLTSIIKSVWEDKTFLQWHEERDDKKRVQHLISWGREYFSHGKD